jgi:hypothetical protein
MDVAASAALRTLDGGPGVDVTLSVIIFADGTWSALEEPPAVVPNSPPDSATVGYCDQNAGLVEQ